MSSLHEAVNPPGMIAPSGFSHAMVAEMGRTVWIAGQIAVDDEGAVHGDNFVAQFDLALTNVVSALRAAGAAPEHVVMMTIFTTAMDGYRTSLAELGPIWRERMGRHYPAVAMLGVTELVEPDAVVEIVAVAVLPPSL
jgi:enamine deaminase RidA (YjgF/YER057c/UK114 family)